MIDEQKERLQRVYIAVEQIKLFLLRNIANSTTDNHEYSILIELEVRLEEYC